MQGHLRGQFALPRLPKWSKKDHPVGEFIGKFLFHLKNSFGNDIEGFVPISQLGVPDLENPGDAVKEGQPVDLKVLEVDPIHHRIVLAVIGYPEGEWIIVPKLEIPPDEM